MLGGSDQSEYTGIGDAGLKNLTSCRELTLLNLGGTKITNAGLQELLPLKSLEMLSVYGTQVTDVGLATLRKPMASASSLKSANSSGVQ